MIQTLQDKLEEARKQWIFSDNDVKEFNSYKLNLDQNNPNINIEDINKSWDEYKKRADETATQLSKLAKDSANKLTNIEESASDIKEKRSDDTRAKLEDTSKEFTDKQDTRYQDVKDITDKQESISNRQANIAAAKAGKYGDIFSDWAMMNVKNDVIAKYGQNILNAEQYALTTNRAIDTDVLNLWLKLVADEDKRNEFKDALLDKENSYMLNAIKEASDGDKKALKDVETFYQTYTKSKADEQYKRSVHTDRRVAMEKEYESMDTPEKQAQVLRDFSYETPWYTLVSDAIPQLISDYPNLSLSQLKTKVAKMGELALTAKQSITDILAIDRDKRTSNEQELLNQYFWRWLEVQQQWDISVVDTNRMNDNNIANNKKTNIKKNSNISYDNPEPSKEDKAKQIADAEIRKQALLEKKKTLINNGSKTKRLADARKYIAEKLDVLKKLKSAWKLKATVYKKYKLALVKKAKSIYKL